MKHRGRQRRLLPGRSSLAFSDAIIDGAPGVFFVVDQKGKFIRWNADLNVLTGCSNAQLCEQFIQSFVLPADRQSIAAKLEEILAIGHAMGELRFQSGKQGVRNYAFSARRFEAAGRRHVAISCQDKTGVRQLESDLLYDKTLADAIIESAPGAFFLIDEQANLVRWNHFLSEETGLSDEQLRGSSILATIHEEDRALAAAKFLAAFATGYAQMEVRVATPHHGLRLFFKTARRFLVDGVPYVAGYCIDVTNRKQAEDALAKEKAFSDALIDGVPGAFYVIDMEGNCFRWNSNLNRLTGLCDEELQQRPLLLSIEENDRPQAAAAMKEAFEKGYAQAELHVLTRDRGVRLYLMTARRFRVDNVAYLVGVGIDTTEQFARVAALEHEAQTDALTQVASRSYFLAKARKEFERCRRYGHPLSLWMLDVDHFKTVNDTYGHHAGDLALQSLVRTSRQALRDWDILGRMGGEEFAVLLPETGSNQTQVVAERLRLAVAATDVPIDAGNVVHLTVSMGIATVRDEDNDVEQLLDRADQALYEAKRSGRDKVCIAERLPNGARAAG